MAVFAKHRFLKITLSIVGVLVALAVIGSFLPPTPAEKSKTDHATSPPVASDSPAPKDDDKQIVKTDDLLLSRAYADNEVAAQNKYGDKTLWVKGYVTGITLDIMSHPVVQMRGTNQFLPTQASFDDSAKGDLSKLHKGDIVTMQCTEITEVVSAPMLSGCTLMANSVR